MLAHSTALIEKKLYFIGGFDDKSADSFFYLDLTESFDISSPAYVDLKASNQLPVGIFWATACVGGANNDTIFVFGGTNWNLETLKYITNNLINTFDSTSQKWSTPQIKGEPIRRRDTQAVIDTKGNMYIFGGGYKFEFDNYTSWFKDMIIFNTITFTYSNGSTNNGPLSMVGYTATLLPNGIIMYIGGRAWNTSAIITIPINNITMYDINEDSWDYFIAKSKNIIQDRSYHSTVLAPDGRIICYGGEARNGSTANPNLIVLNTTTFPFEWYSPDYSGTNEPPGLEAHSANLFENYMIIGFGNITNDYSSSLTASSSIFILDIRNYTWISYYEATPRKQYPPSKPSLSVGAIVGISFGATIVFGFILFFGIRYHMNNRKESPDFLVSDTGAHQISQNQIPQNTR